MNANKTNKILRIFMLLTLGVLTFLTTSWTLNKDFYFLFDDVAWLKEVKFSFDIRNFFHILPISRYNDRPLRTLWFYILFNLFELDYTSYYLVTLLWHVLDSYLVFSLSYRVFSITDNILSKRAQFFKSFLISLLFGIYPKNIMAVYWLAGAANDLLCGFFSLLSMQFYINYIKNRKAWFSVLISLFCYICAMRSKEAAIGLPIIILLFETYILWEGKKRFKIFLGNVVLLLYMVIYLIKIFTLPATLTTEGQYKQEFDIGTVFRVLLNYIRMYFALDDGSFSYRVGEYTTKVGNIGIVICTAILVILLSNLYRKKAVKESVGVIVLFLCTGIALAPLLVLPNIQHMLYFYFPAFFLSMFWGICFYETTSYLLKLKYSDIIISCIAVALLAYANNTGGAKQIRMNFEQWGREAKSTVSDIEGIETLPSNTTLYLKGADKGANVFNYAPGYIVNIIYNDSSITSELVDDDTVYRLPYAVWEYHSGHVVELERVIK